MRLYQSPDGVWTGTQADAKAHARDANTTWKETEVPVDKAGLMAFLNQHRVGAASSVSPAPAPAAPPPPPPSSYTHESVALDDAWEGLSLARKLHFAALAMEDARLKIG